MSDPFIGEIRMFGGNYAPDGWLFCQGQLVSISDYDTLFALIGTTYGGDGVNTFGLPNLASRVPIHAGNGGGGSYVIGQNGGAETVTLTSQQLPVHTHQAAASNAGSTTSPSGAVWAAGATGQYAQSTPTVSMSPSALSSYGGNQPHDNMLPFLAINFIISMFGIYPTPS